MIRGSNEKLFKIERKYLVVPVFRANYVTYADPDKKDLFAGEDGVHDMVVYAFPGEESN